MDGEIVKLFLQSKEKLKDFFIFLFFLRTIKLLRNRPISDKVLS
jgi:hypothetical protein